MLEYLKGRTKVGQSTVEIAPALSSAHDLAFSRDLITTRTTDWGWLPAISLVSAIGLMLISIANALSRSGISGAEPLFWAGLLGLIVPASVRLAAREVGRHERISLVVMLGLELYLVKIMHSSFAFTFFDELFHYNNVLEILRSGNVFPTNSIFPVSAQYPGLEIVTAALASMTGLSAFAAGILVIGVARLVFTLALFLFYEKISDSTRAAGLAALIYSASPNYVFFSAQYSYESLALPLALLVLYAAVRRSEAREDSRAAYTIIALLGTMGVVITHHMSSYFLIVFLVLWSLLYSYAPQLLSTSIVRVMKERMSGLFRKRNKSPMPAPRAAPGGWRFLYRLNVFRSPSPAGLALSALVICLLWQTLVANLTSKYLLPILGPAITSVIQMISGEEAGRQLFHSSGSYVTPLGERLMGIGSVLICLVGLPFGLRAVWRRHRNSVLALLLAGAAIAYFGMLGLRFTPAAWQTGNRASEFLFVGIAFVLAYSGLEFWQPRRFRWLGRILFAGCVSLTIMGGLVASWPPWLRLAQPYSLAAGGVAIKPEGLTAADWALSVLGPSNQIAADTTNGLLMLTYGRQTVFGDTYHTQVLLLQPGWGDWQRNILRDAKIVYVVVDRRERSWDTMTGLYFNLTGRVPIYVTELVDREANGKFDAMENVSRIFDSGYITIYDVRAINDEPFDK